MINVSNSDFLFVIFYFLFEKCTDLLVKLKIEN
jgi:hypothetical protein